MCGLNPEGGTQFSSGLWPRKLVRLENKRSPLCSLPWQNGNSVETYEQVIKHLPHAASGREEIGVSCAAAARVACATMVSTESDHVSDAAVVYSHEMPRRVRVMVGKGSYACHSLYIYSNIH